MDKKKILIADDEKNILKLLEKILTEAGYEVFKASNGYEVLKLAKKVVPDLILLDIMMPHMGGREARVKLNDDIITAGIPVIFLTALNATGDKVKGLKLGVDDYITKPCDMDELLARIESALLRRVYYEKIAMTDGLTGLYNVHYFKKQLSLFYNMAKRYKQRFSLAVIDVDNLKNINDSYGHTVGDYVLKKFSSIMEKTLRRSDIISRYGGDEFSVIFPESDEAQAKRAMDRVMDEIMDKWFNVEGEDQKISFSISIGVAEYHSNLKNEKELFKLADDNMYGIKIVKRKNMWDKEQKPRYLNTNVNPFPVYGS
ncbi:MAG: diguanylate cyclase [Endomicrobiales bacterium]|nr:diguanylate cyclase [Endomicrobiales bacterium]